MLTTTRTLLKQNHACMGSYAKLVKGLGGATTYGDETPIPLTRILDILNVQDTLWAFRALEDGQGDESRRILITFSCDVAERVLNVFEEAYPDDHRPHKAIAAARACVTDKSAHAAAYAAAHAAAETGWQESRLRALLQGVTE